MAISVNMNLFVDGGVLTIFLCLCTYSLHTSIDRCINKQYTCILQLLLFMYINM